MSDPEPVIIKFDNSLKEQMIRVLSDHTVDGLILIFEKGGQTGVMINRKILENVNAQQWIVDLLSESIQRLR